MCQPRFVILESGSTVFCAPSFTTHVHMHLHACSTTVSHTSSQQLRIFCMTGCQYISSAGVSRGGSRSSEGDGAQHESISDPKGTGTESSVHQLELRLHQALQERDALLDHVLEQRGSGVVCASICCSARFRVIPLCKNRHRSVVRDYRCYMNVLEFTASVPARWLGAHARDTWVQCVWYRMVVPQGSLQYLVLYSILPRGSWVGPGKNIQLSKFPALS